MIIRRLPRILATFAFVATASPTLAQGPSTFVQDRGADRVCVSWGDPHYQTFSGNRYDWYAEGEFIMHSSLDSGEAIHVVAQQPERSERPYNSGVAFATGTGERRETLYTAPIDAEMDTTVQLMHVNSKGTITPVGPDVRRIGAFSITRFCASGAEVDKRQLLERIAIRADGGSMLRVELRREAGVSHLDASVKVPSGTSAQGVCGPLAAEGSDAGALPDCAPPEGVRVDAKATCEAIAETWRVEPKASLFP